MMFEVRRVLGLSTVQDLGRPGFMHLGVPRGGALVPELLVIANRSVGNPDGAAGIEVMGQLTIYAAADLVIAIDDQPARVVRAGQDVVVASGNRRCAYLAVRGSVWAPTVMGGRGAILSAGIGWPLKNGEQMVLGGATETGPAKPPRFVERDTITILPGPDLEAFTDDAIATLTGTPYKILPASNRVGTRLAGPALRRRPEFRERSRPMVKGALEVPRDGQPIVLGPEHPTTGGYPIVAVIATAELGRFHAIRLGGTVRFSLTSSR